jgi:eukaryotic-like serine/threonine-protein kinase
MPLEIRSPAILRFGTFEVDMRAGELRKQGVRIKLQEQPFHVLTVLLQRPGEVVTREELRNQNWPADTFVDFDNSLNTAINKLREALGDSADNPRFIETLPRRGYRFIAPVMSDERKTPAITATGWKLVVPVAVAVFLAILMGGALLWRSRQGRRLTEKDTIVLADFTNTTGDPVFDDTLKQGLQVQLEQSPFLNILSEQKVAQTLGLMGRSPEQRLTPELARDLCQRVGSKATLTGTISSLGTHYVIGLNAVNCETGDTLGSEQAEADSREHVLRSLGESSTKMRRKLGESLPSIQRFDAPIEQVTTSSLEALHAYGLGMKNKSANKDAESIPFFKRAIELDPNFASAYAMLTLCYVNLGEQVLAADNAKKAFALRDRVGEREKLRISAFYYCNDLGDCEKARQMLELWAQTYPRDYLPHTNLSSLYMRLGQWEKALVEAQKALALNLNYGANYYNLGSIDVALGLLDAAKDVGRQAAMQRMDDAYMHLILYWTAFLQQDPAEMDRQMRTAIERSGGSWDADNFLLLAQSYTEAYEGRLARARDFSHRAVEAALRANAREAGAELQADAALREAEFGERQRARADADAAMGMAANQWVEAEAALALARADESMRAEKLVTQLNKSFPMGTALQGYWLPTIRGAIELKRDNAAKAIEVLQRATPYELATAGPFELGMMYPVYIRGQAYLMARQGKEAAAEFQKIIDHRGVVLNFPLGALAHLQLARAYALQRDTTNSRTAYQDFLTLWKDADPDIPILQQAKAEYAKLQ